MNSKGILCGMEKDWKQQMLLVSSVLVSLVIVVHAFRIVEDWSVCVQGFYIPQWVNALAIGVLIVVLYGNVKALRS